MMCSCLLDNYVKIVVSISLLGSKEGSIARMLALIV